MSRALLIVDHGSRRREANEQFEELARMLRNRLPNDVVLTAHLELVPPTIGEGIDACVAGGADTIIVHPYFLGPGRHTTRDIPDQVAEAMKRHPNIRVRVSEPLGLHPKLVDVILDRVGLSKG
jgi:sirohydrochlorin ferrochelatase